MQYKDFVGLIVSIVKLDKTRVTLYFKVSLLLCNYMNKYQVILVNMYLL